MKISGRTYQAGRPAGPAGRAFPPKNFRMIFVWISLALRRELRPEPPTLRSELRPGLSGQTGPMLGNTQAELARQSGLNSGRDSQAQYSGWTSPTIRHKLRLGLSGPILRPDLPNTQAKLMLVLSGPILRPNQPDAQA